MGLQGGDCLQELEQGWMEYNGGRDQYIVQGRLPMTSAKGEGNGRQREKKCVEVCRNMRTENGCPQRDVQTKEMNSCVVTQRVVKKCAATDSYHSRLTIVFHGTTGEKRDGSRTDCPSVPKKQKEKRGQEQKG